jgi:hypothetical protein
VNHTNLLLLSVFVSVVAGVFQITFRVKMHVNDVFLFFKNHFWHQHIKTIQNIQTILNFNQKKKLKFFRNTAAPPSTPPSLSTPEWCWAFGYRRHQIYFKV